MEEPAGKDGLALAPGPRRECSAALRRAPPLRLSITENAGFYGFECFLRRQGHGFSAGALRCAGSEKHPAPMNCWYGMLHWKFDREKLCFAEASDCSGHAGVREQSGPGRALRWWTGAVRHPEPLPHGGAKAAPAAPACPEGGTAPLGRAAPSGAGHAGLSEGTAPFVRQQAAKSCVETRKSAPARLWDVKRRFTEGRLRGAWRLLKGVRHARRYRGGASPPWAMVMKSLTRFTRLASLEPAS